MVGLIKGGMLMIRRVKISSLLLDYTLYPRREVDALQVSRMAEALRAGRKLPPITVDEKSKRVIDGWHRIKAHEQLKITTIEANLKAYKDEAEMFLDAVRLNATHGRQLMTYDHTRCIAKADELNIAPEAIADALNITVERCDKLREVRFASYAGKPVALKRTLGHLAGTKLTSKQAGFLSRAGGMNQLFYVNQVIGLVESESIDWGNTPLVMALNRLYELLKKRAVQIKQAVG